MDKQKGIIKFKDYEGEYLWISDDLVRATDTDIQDYLDNNYYNQEENKVYCPRFATKAIKNKFSFDLEDVIYRKLESKCITENIFNFNDNEFKNISKMLDKWIDKQRPYYYTEDENIQIDLTELAEIFGYNII